ncbi:MAG TPA: tail fiber protein [Reyranella sp.]|jgi:microcystin-dependent protein|nr:tail fiber protein [Reyranella sp.]
MSEPFMGQIEIFGFDFAPLQWAKCTGQVMSISQNQALFSLLGTTYGGNGITTFALPNLQSRVAVGAGKDRVQVDWVRGQADGEEKLALTSMQLAAHDHTVMAASSTDVTKDTQTPGNTVGLGQTIGDDQGTTMAVNAYVVDAKPAAALHYSAVSPGPAAQPHENRMPVQALNFCISLLGVFPSRG